MVYMSVYTYSEILEHNNYVCYATNLVYTYTYSASATCVGYRNCQKSGKTVLLLKSRVEVIGRVSELLISSTVSVVVVDAEYYNRMARSLVDQWI